MSIYTVSGGAFNNPFSVGGLPVNVCYDISSNIVFQSGSIDDIPVGITEIFSIDNEEIGAGSESPQGMAIYNGYVFQYFSDKKIRVFDENSFELVNTLSATNVGHGNGFQFGKTKEASGYPLCYVSDGNQWTASPYLYTLSLTPTAVSKLGTFTFPSAVGNLPNCCIDFDTNTMYVLGYSTTKYGTAGEMYVSVYDMDSQEIINKWTIDYIGVEQGIAYYNGKLIISCSAHSAATTYFYIFNLTTGQIESTYSYGKTTNEEYEDFHLVECADGFYLITSNWITTNDGKYYRLLTVRFE